jgi:hypothetical protein
MPTERPPCGAWIGGDAVPLPLVSQPRRRSTGRAVLPAVRPQPESTRPFGFGAPLREARVARGHCLKALSVQLRIREVILVALEEERLEDLPEPVIARGFLAQYARALGLDAGVIVQSFPCRTRRSPPPTVIESPRWWLNGPRLVWRVLPMLVFVGILLWLALRIVASGTPMAGGTT